MKGTLYKGGVITDPFEDATAPFDFRIISTKITHIVPPVKIEDIQYIVRDPLMQVPLGVFTIVDTDVGILQMEFEIRRATPGVGVDPTVMRLKVVSGIVQPEIMIYTTNNDKVGDFDVIIRTRFNVNIPYYVDSSIFNIKILHQCVKNVIYGRQLVDRAYNIS
jgi:hypothetical protein